MNAVLVLSQVLKIEAENAKALFRRGTARHALGQTDLALADLQAAATKWANAGWTYIWTCGSVAAMSVLPETLDVAVCLNCWPYADPPAKHMLIAQADLATHLFVCAHARSDARVVSEWWASGEWVWVRGEWWVSGGWVVSEWWVGGERVIIERGLLGQICEWVVGEWWVSGEWVVSKW